jgi:lipopolysaccharide/colanic/teichoic acid biosynthesis glycosyltransferase/ADP-glucose pyrophosphorylase
MRAIVLADDPTDGVGPLTLDLPTAALPLAGKPVVCRMLDYLERQGATSAVVASQRWPFLVERAVAGFAGQLPVSFSLLTPSAGSGRLRQVAAHLHDRFVLVAGNMLTDLDLRAAVEQHRHSQALVTMLVTEVSSPCLYGEVVTDANNAVVMVGSEQLVRRNGPRLANTGIYIMEPEVLERMPRSGELDLARELLPYLVEQELPIFASRQTGFWCAISSHEQFRAANLSVLSGSVMGVRPDGNEVSDGIWVADGARVDAAAALEPPVHIGKNVRVHRDAVIGPHAVLGEGVRVRRGGVVRRTVMLPGSTVGLATRLEDSVVRGNVLARSTSAEPTYVDDRQVLEPLDPVGGRSTLRSTVDRLLALIALLVLAPIMLLIALAIKLDSKGPVFYSQLRVGQGRRSAAGQYQGRVFELMKFRTMTHDADRRLKEVLDDNEYGAAPFVKIKHDSRITRIGHFLRATSLDELPQFINVVKGDMALVGNRPLPLYEAEQLGHDWQRLRFNAPAGITGLWQISGRSDLSAEERIVLDNYYALTHSPWSDIKILLITIPALLARRGAR